METIDLLEKYGLDYPPGGWDLPPGWVGIVDDLIADLLELGWDGKIGQVKEKFGGLRFYIDSIMEDPDLHEAIYDRISKAEIESQKTCQDCGEPGKAVEVKFWWTTLCPKCQTK